MRQGVERRWEAAAALAVLLAAGPAAMAWSTYLRAGPAETSAAIAELEHDTPVQVGACGGGWCQVSDGAATGYVDKDALTLPRTTPPSPPARTDCVVAGQADNRGPIPTRFCSAAPSGK